MVTRSPQDTAGNRKVVKAAEEGRSLVGRIAANRGPQAGGDEV